MGVAVTQTQLVAAALAPTHSGSPKANTSDYLFDEQDDVGEYTSLLQGIFSRIAQFGSQNTTEKATVMTKFEITVSDSQNELILTTEGVEGYNLAIMSEAEIRRIIESYEEQFGMTSEDFLLQWEAGEAPDTFETNDWAILLGSR